MTLTSLGLKAYAYSIAYRVHEEIVSSRSRASGATDEQITQREIAVTTLHKELLEACDEYYNRRIEDAKGSNSSSPDQEAD